MNYYNEFDKNAVAWLRELIKLGAIPDGEVDERSIEDVRAEDLKGFVQCHFFAGIAGWPEALRRAGVPATRPLWTGSCPCQDFSCAGKQEGFEGKRDLWPAFFNLIKECRPERVFGEQVKNAVRHGWLDRLYADLETAGYACGSAVLGAHSAGADHIRQRIYWMADSGIGACKRYTGSVSGAQAAVGCENRKEYGDCVVGSSDGSHCEPIGLADAQHAERRPERPEHTEPHGRDGLGGSGVSCGLADAERDGWNERRAEREGLGGSAAPVGRSAVGGVGNAAGDDQRRDSVSGTHGEGVPTGGSGGVGKLGEPSQPGLQGHSGDVADGDEPGRLGTLAAGPASETGFARNFWAGATPHLCKDGKWRRYEDAIFPLVGRFKPGVQPMADEPARAVGHCGDPRLAEYADQTAEARVMRLKGYGNAICVDTAVLFIEACEDVLK